MSKKISVIMSISLIVISFTATLLSYQRLPEAIVIHWNAAGQMNGTAQKGYAAFTMPVIQLAVYLLLIGIPLMDPRRENIEKFKNTYDLFLTGLMGFLTYIQVLVITYNLGGRLDMTQWIIPGVAVLMYFTGHLVSHAHQNYFIGIRTPWTLSNERVWEDTHRLGGIGFKVTGLVIFCGLLFPPVAFLFIIVPLLVLPVLLMGYSYFRFMELSR